MRIFRVVCLAMLAVSTLSADDNHPELAKSQVVTLDARTIEAHANAEKPFTLVLGDSSVDVVLRPDPIAPKEGVPVLESGAGSSTKEYVLPGSPTYSGDVIGDDPATSEVRFTIADGLLDGYVLTKDDWLFVEPYSRFNEKARANEYLVYSTHDFTSELNPDGDVPDRVIDHTRVPIDPTIPLAFAADYEFFTFPGATARQDAVLNNVNGIFERQTGRKFVVVIRLWENLGERLTSRNPERLLDQLEDFVAGYGGLDHPNLRGADVVHLTVGKVLNGGVLTAARRRDHYGVSAPSLYPALAYRNTIMMARALGKNYNAGPEQAARWCITPTATGGCQRYWQTIMYPAFSGSTKPYFSDPFFDPFPEKDNISLICSEMSSRGFPCLLP
jgi:hypothetical protein